MSRHRLSKAASEDLVAIHSQGHDQFGPRRADRCQDERDALFLRLAASPGMIRLRLEYDPPVRAFAFKAHVIIHDPHESGDERSEP